MKKLVTGILSIPYFIYGVIAYMIWSEVLMFGLLIVCAISGEDSCEEWIRKMWKALCKILFIGWVIDDL